MYRKFKFSTSSYYNYCKHKKSEYYAQRRAIYERIKYIYYNSNCTFGYRVMQVVLSRYGIHLSKLTVHKYMNNHLNLKAVIMRKKPNYIAGKKHKIFDNIIKQGFTIDSKNKAWCTDFTYMFINGQVRYNCTIIDLFDRSVIASMNDSHITSEPAINTLKKALINEKYPKELILHSDQGSQFTSYEFVEFCKKNNIIQSMSKAGCPYDNSPMERFYNTFKNCFYYRYAFSNAEQLDEMTERYINYYNYVRPHSYNGYLTPMEKRFK